ncbi:MAG: MFS transporter [Acidimicrobiales bacterium]
MRTRDARLFYGWIVALAAFAILAVSYGLTFSYGVFIKSLSADLGWSKAEVTLPYSIYILVYGLLGSVAGWATDRSGPRAVIAVGAVFLGVGFALVGLTHHLWQLYLSLGVVAAIGMSAAWVPCNATVVRWFRLKRGRALSISSTGGSFGNVLAPIVGAALVASIGWRWSFAALGAFATVVMLALSRLMVRDPERMGLTVDGAPPAPPGAPAPAPEASMTMAEARRTRSFWVIFALFSVVWLVVFVPQIHLPGFVEDLGFSKFAGAAAVSCVGLGGMAGRLTMGGLSDRLGRLPCLGALLGLQTVSFVSFALTGSLGVLYPTAVAFGFAYGGGVVIFPALVGDYFGREHVGAIVGIIFAGATPPGAFAPFLAGWLYDVTGGYRISFVLGVVVSVAALALLALLRASAPAGAARDAPRAAAAPTSA